MAAVDRPIRINAVTSARFLPNRSPKCPNSMPPTGRATKPTAKVLNAAICAATGGISAGKNRVGKTKAAAVP